MTQCKSNGEAVNTSTKNKNLKMEQQKYECHHCGVELESPKHVESIDEENGVFSWPWHYCAWIKYDDPPNTGYTLPCRNIICKRCGFGFCKYHTKVNN